MNSELFSVVAEDIGKLSMRQLVDELEARAIVLPDSKKLATKALLADNERRTKEGSLEMYCQTRNQSQATAMELADTKHHLALLQIELTNIKQQLQTPHQSQNTSPLANDTTDILRIMAENQQRLTQNFAQPVIQIQSTTDTAKAIPVFGGELIQSAMDWVTEVERVAASAHWSSTLTLVNAHTRLTGSAANWQKTSGKQFNDWLTWKDAFVIRFKRKLTMIEFIKKQAERTLLETESITSYIYAKNALLELSPHPLNEEERISMIIGDIQDDRWATPLLANPSRTVSELIDKASALDFRRKVKNREQKYAGNEQSTSARNDRFGYNERFKPRQSQFEHSREQQGTNRQNQLPHLHKFNPKSGDQLSKQFCWRCGEQGHIMPQCSLPKPPRGTPIAEPKMNSTNIKPPDPPPITTKPAQHRRNQVKSDNQVNCVCDSTTHPTLIPAGINGNIIEALPDNGSSVTLLHEDLIPANTELMEWTDGDYKVAGGSMTPVGWITAQLTVGSVDVIMPKIGICKSLPVPLILGLDWQHRVQATITTDHLGTVCITTPSSSNIFVCGKKTAHAMACTIRPKPTIQPENRTKSDQPTQDQIQDIYNQIVTEYKDVFSESEKDIGEFKDIELNINLLHNKPIACKPYRLSHPDRQFVKSHIDKWLEMGVCRSSTSPYAAPTFVIDQPFHPSTPRRVVIDYSKTINPITIPDPHPIDRMDDLLSKISGKTFKTILDIRQAYLNIKVKSEDIHKTAIVTPDDHVEFTRVMFGLSGGPAIMSRVIKKTFGHLFADGVGTYFDDVALGHDDFQHHLTVVKRVLQACREKNLKLKQDCIFAQREVKLLGRILTPYGEKPDPERTDAVTKYKTLNSTQEIRSFLGFANTYRKYIKGYATMSRHLTTLLRIPEEQRKHTLGKTRKSLNKKIRLDPVQQQAFEDLKIAISTPPVLAYFRQGCTTYVETDASYSGLGACLSQDHENTKKVIEYASRTLTDIETRYHINELECTAVHWALTQKFRLYLLGQPFTLITDSYSTAYIVNKAKLNRKFARYVVDLAAFEFTATHRPGKENTVADHLSRYPAQPKDHSFNNESFTCLAVITTPDSQLQRAQQADSFCRNILTKLSSQENKHHIKQIQQIFLLEDHILLHQSTEKGILKKKIVIPLTLRSNVLKICHDDTGHFDTSKTIDRVKSNYWWKTLSSDVKAYIRGCAVCQHVNRKTTIPLGLLGDRPLPTIPWECISADHLSLPQTAKGNLHILVHIDHTTRYVIARPTCTLAALDVCHTIETDIIFHYGPPLIYISDNGTSFTSRTTQKLFAKYGIQHALTPPYTPQSNGLVERENSTIICTIKKMALDHPADWDTLLPNALLNINTSKHSSARYSPFYLLHGYTPRIPPDQIGIGVVTSEETRQQQLESLDHSRQDAINNIARIHESNKRRFDAHRSNFAFQPGDQVLYSWPQATDTKLTPTFKGPYTVISTVGNVCYRIKPTSKLSKQDIRIVHVQSLRPYHDRPNLDKTIVIFSTDSSPSPDSIRPHDPLHDSTIVESTLEPTTVLPPEKLLNTTMPLVTDKPDQTQHQELTPRNRRYPRYLADFDLDK